MISVSFFERIRELVETNRYSQITESLIYLASATRLDISFVVSKLSRVISNLGDDHWCVLE
jgi:hypothetical protein